MIVEFLLSQKKLFVAQKVSYLLIPEIVLLIVAYY